MPASACEGYAEGARFVQAWCSVHACTGKCCLRTLYCVNLHGGISLHEQACEMIQDVQAWLLCPCTSGLLECAQFRWYCWSRSVQDVVYPPA